MTTNEIFNKGGLLEKKLEGFESRPQQARMAMLVETAIEKKKTAVVEGSTGVGKGFAYLIPIILAGKKAIVSTSNKNLQDQLNNKDLPTLKKVLKKVDFNWTVLKGKSNYFCHQNFMAHYPELERSLDTHDLNAVKKWASETKDGDLDTCPIYIPPHLKSYVGHDPDVRHGEDDSADSICFASLAKEKAKEAQIILINHSLLTLNIAMKRPFLPKVDVIVVDEAHSLERCASTAFSEELTFWSLKHFLDSNFVKKSITAKARDEMNETFRIALEKYLPTKDGYYYKPMRVKKFEGFEKVISALEMAISKVSANSKFGNDEMAVVRKKSIINEGNNLVEKLSQFSKEDENFVMWTEAYDGKRGTTIKMMLAPISVAKLLGTYFQKRTCVFTSATLSTNGNFDFFKEQIGLDQKECLELIEQSPFDFENNSMAYITTGQTDKIKEVEQLLKYSKGRAFVLFTSYREMFTYYENVDIPYKKLVQAQGVSKSQLLKDFRESENAVLFATRSFWEGVDVKGEKLSMVIIHKIPFANPSDLIYQSKTEQIEKKYGKGAYWPKYTIPDACLALKQGFGRLIRSKTDRGVYVLMDERVITKSYRNPILRTLPPATPRTQKLERIKAFFDKIGS